MSSFRHLALVVACGVLGGCMGTGNATRDISTANPVESIHSILAPSDAIVASDLLLVHPRLVQQAAGSHRLQVSCEDRACAAAGVPEPLGETFDEWSKMTARDFHEGRHADVGEWWETINGVPFGIFSGRSGDDDLTFVSFGGWMKHSAFGTDLIFDGEEPLWGYAFSAGVGANGNPVGDATWKGAMIGNVADATRPEVFHRIQGEATVTFRLEDATLDVAFTGIHDIDAQLAEHAAHPAMRWEGLKVRDGLFREGSAGDLIQGQFYGPGHQEVGGIFERDSIVGGFGARRAP